MSHRFTIATLSELLRVTQDSERGLSICAHHAHAEPLRTLLAALARRSSAASGELEALIAQLGGIHKVDGLHAALAPLSAARHGWMHLRAAVAQDDDDALIDACERGEDYALEVYRNALDDHLPEFVRQTVMRQFEDLVSDQDRIRIIRSEPLAGGGTSIGEHARQ